MEVLVIRSWEARNGQAVVIQGRIKCFEISRAKGRQPAKVKGKQQDQHHTNPEARKRGQRHRHRRCCKIQKAVLLHRRKDTHQRTDHCTDQDRSHGQRNGYRQTGHQLAGNRPVRFPGISQITVKRIYDIIHIPNQKRVIVFQLVIFCFYFLPRCTLTENQRSGIARCQIHDEQNDKNYRQQCGNQHQKPFCYVFQHVIFLPFPLPAPPKPGAHVLLYSNKAV